MRPEPWRAGGLVYLLIGASLLLYADLQVRAAGSSNELEAGTGYQWTHEKRAGFEAWQHYVLCDDLTSARAFTDEILASVESQERASGHAVGAHLNFVFPSHLSCEKRDTVAFTPLAEQLAEGMSTLGFAMVYLPASETARATHVCAGRPCALAPVLRQFIQVDVDGDVAKTGAWLRVGPAIKVKSKVAP